MCEEKKIMCNSIAATAGRDEWSGFPRNRVTMTAPEAVKWRTT